MYWLSNRGVPRLESEPCGQLKLTPGTDRGKYSTDVIGESASCIFEDRVAVPSQGKGALCISRNSEIWVIEQIVGFHSEHDPRAFPQLDALMQSQIELRKGGTAQDIPPGITELTGSRQLGQVPV